MKKTGNHYVFKSKSDKQEIDREFSDLGGMYFRMSRKNKRKVQRPESPIKPYLKLITEKGNVYYKLESELNEEDKKNIPPPPFARNGTTIEKEKALKLYKEWAKRLKLVKQN